MSSDTGASSGGGGSVSFNTSFSDINSGLFGENGVTDATGTKTESATTSQTERLDIDRVGLLKLIDDALKGVGGLSEIFGQAAGSGLFGASASKQGTEDLLAKIAGELAKVTGVKTATTAGNKATVQDSSTTTQADGILDNLGFGGNILEGAISATEALSPVVNLVTLGQGDKIVSGIKSLGDKLGL